MPIFFSRSSAFSEARWRALGVRGGRGPASGPGVKAELNLDSASAEVTHRPGKRTASRRTTPAGVRVPRMIHLTMQEAVTGRPGRKGGIRLAASASDRTVSFSMDVVAIEPLLLGPWSRAHFARRGPVWSRLA